MTESALPPIIREANRFRAALLARDAAAVKRLVGAYADVNKRLDQAVTALLASFGTDPMSPDAIRRLDRFRELEAQVEREMRSYLGYVEIEMRKGVQVEIARGLADGAAMVRATLPAGAYGDAVFKAAWNRLDTAAVETMLGFLSPASPLTKRLGELAGVVSKAIADELVRGIALGLNPRQVGRIIAKAGGMGLADALRHARTAQLYAYRESSRAEYLANPDIVGSWMWYADLNGPNTCSACIMMHGRVFPATEVLDDHWNGRCRDVPVVDWSTIGVNLPPLNYGPTGPQWFEMQTPERQLAILGPGKFELYQGGSLDLSRLVKQVTDNVYGPMKVEAALHELLGPAQ
jgi:hypothetical protein